ncbi:hypothetical protein OU415_02075 [Saccharopolyspora sp. WRP15-2]|uniref:Uncharacterized protein n=1 Tax=Saccharopolyspora oryzae TaxID=2997343 RepID=A0ABT4UR61_9PSEU|nr:hypothetical protein [Saccharopolyspora oryzae]MDA3624203.1 hypothetical protein [Saccharopolyspora oryzae]
MFWLQLGTLVAINLVIWGMLLLPSSHRQHGDAGEGSYDVWRLIGDVEAERAAEYAGRHRLREWSGESSVSAEAVVWPPPNTP